ncbi:ATPase family associated with various cellular activities (AAA) domain-containing protein [Ditylenchus destructor]|uniref:Activator 1 subunit 5 n=1 Tax=Ditylenchus destructor TaxID=166010 RepID=A0AAD4NGB0_9BILA|nr:ATPase family associated with various cellular activities (AAA) domain-containing protein [Ditylenchus destructor]
MVNLVETTGPSGNLPWVEKYRPESLKDLVSHQEIIKTITRLIDEDKMPHLLFYGPPGTGKTSTILAAARSIYTPKQMHSMVLELNASDDRGINVVRQKIVDFASMRNLGSSDGDRRPVKLIILDEADAMTKDAQNALRRVIEKYTDSTRFCIICNYLSKIIPALQSRCTRFRFAPLSKDQVSPRLDYIIQTEAIRATESGKDALFKLSNGDMRRVINVLQSTSLAFEEVNEETVYQCVGQAPPSVIKNILQILLDESFEKACEKLNELSLQHGIALADTLDEILELILGLDMPQNVAALLMDRIAQIEHRLSSGCSEKIQWLSLISAFTDSKVVLFKNFEN